MNDLERIRAVKNATQYRLLSIPGVHTVSIGAKNVSGQKTAELAIVVSVVKKKPLSELSPDDVIPPGIDGVKTDVVEEGKPVLHADDNSYRPLCGGIQIRPGSIESSSGTDLTGFGTLGCIASISKVQKVAITNQHVVTWEGEPTKLIATVSSDGSTITFSGENTPRSVIIVGLNDKGPEPEYPPEGVEWYSLLVTDDTDTIEGVASKVASRIYRSTATGGQVKIISNPGITTVVRKCGVRDPVPSDPSAELHAQVFPQPSESGIPTVNLIIFSGRVSGEYYGVYTNAHFADRRPSLGAFTPLAEGDTLTSIVSSIVKSLGVALQDGLNRELPWTDVTLSAPVTPGEAQIAIQGPTFVECLVSSDVRVGQPDHTFPSICCYCCDQSIGRVIDARLDLDIALIQLDPGLQYEARVEKIGVIDGTLQSVDINFGEDVVKGTDVILRGRSTTEVSHGTIIRVDATGVVEVLEPEKGYYRFHRFYKDALMIESANSDPFSQEGDSGSAVIHVDENGRNLVVGILFAGNPDAGNPDEKKLSLATPIDTISRVFDISIEDAETSPGIQTVWTVEGAPTSTMAANSVAAGHGIAPFTAIGDRLRQMEREITATPAGARYAALVRRHFLEVHCLVNTNRRVATAWHRNGGPQLMQRLMQVFQRPDAALPVEVDGKPLTACLARLQEILMRYGSPLLSADLRANGSALGKLAGLTYPQILVALQTWTGD